MHPAVDLLIKRMESNPDEFVEGHKKSRIWDALITRYESFMTKEENAVVKHKYSEIQMGQMHKEIMAELLRTENENKKETPHQFTLPFDEVTTR